MNALFPLLLAGSLLAAWARAEPLSEPQFQSLTEAVFRPVLEAHAIPGMAIGVTLRGRSYVYTTGLADRAGGRRVAGDTLFELGSVSKLFTVALAATAAEEGRLRLDAPVSSLRPGLAGSAFDRITLYDLAASANGGLPLQVPDGIRDTDALNAWLADWTPGGDPQQIRSYSNVSIGLLGQIAAGAFASSYAPALQNHVLAPLGLENTYLTVPKADLPRYAWGYARADNRPLRVNPGLLDAEAYGVKSTVSDMTQFLAAHLGQGDLPAPLDAALRATRSAQYVTAHFAQGMVWEAYPWPVDPAQLAAGNAPDMALKPQPLSRRADPDTGQMLLSKTGSTGGFGAYVALLPQEDLGVVVLANRNYPNTVRVEATLQLIRGLLALPE